MGRRGAGRKGSREEGQGAVARAEGPGLQERGRPSPRALGPSSAAPSSAPPTASGSPGPRPPPPPCCRLQGSPERERMPGPRDGAGGGGGGRHGGRPGQGSPASRGPGLALSTDPGRPCPSRRVRAPRGAWSMTHSPCGRSLPGVTRASHLPLGVDVSELALNLRTDVAGLCCPFWVSLPRGWMCEPPAPRERRWGVHPPCFSRVFYLVTMPVSTHGLLTVGAGRLWSGSMVRGGRSPCPCQVSSTKSA